MADTLLTYLQLFGIGLSFGMAGPCLFFCTPIMTAYVAGAHKNFADSIKDLVLFLAGRTLAYTVLGCAAGASGSLLRHFTSSNFSALMKPIGGIISIILGIFVLLAKEGCGCASPHREGHKMPGPLFVFGFLVGFAPCVPLTTLLFEIALISKSVLAGASYALAFGAGTLVASLVVIGVSAGIIRWVPAKLLTSEKAAFAFRAVCGILLVIFGIALIFKTYA